MMNVTRCLNVLDAFDGLPEGSWALIQRHKYLLKDKRPPTLNSVGWTQQTTSFQRDFMVKTIQNRVICFQVAATRVLTSELTGPNDLQKRASEAAGSESHN